MYVKKWIPKFCRKCDQTGKKSLLYPTQVLDCVKAANKYINIKLTRAILISISTF